MRSGELYKRFNIRVFSEALNEAAEEFPKEEVRHVGEYGEYNEEYFPYDAMKAWFLKWFGVSPKKRSEENE